MDKFCILINGPIRGGINHACETLKYYIHENINNNNDIYITTWKRNDDIKYDENF